MSLKLYSLKKEYKKHLTSMLDEWTKYSNKKIANNEFVDLSPNVIFSVPYQNFDTYLEFLKPKSNKENKVPNSTYFLYDDEYDIFLGAINVRHYQNDLLKKYFGHIGYGIRPSMRKRGYGEKILALAIPLCKQLGISRIYLSCFEYNIASEKIMLKNGAIFDCSINYEGTILKRYYIDLVNIKVTLYNNSEEFILDYNTLFKSNIESIDSFILDNIYNYARSVDNMSKSSYIIKINLNDDNIIAIKPKGKELLLLGSRNPAKYLVNYLLENNYYFSNILGSNEVCYEFKKNLTKIGIRETEAYTYYIYSHKPTNEDFMLDIVPKISDVTSLLDIIREYDNENKLYLNINKDDIIKNLNCYRILKKDNEIMVYLKFEEEKNYLLIDEIYSNKKYRYERVAINNFIKQFLYEASKYNKIVYSFVYYLYAYLQFNYVCEYYYCKSLENHIFGNKIVLRKAKDSDLVSIYNNVWSDASLASNMFWRPTTNIIEAKSRLKRTKHHHKNVELSYFIALKDTDEVIGFANFVKNDDNTYSEHGICIGGKYQNQGIGTEVLSIALDFIFNTLEGDAFYYSVCSNNLQSKALLKKYPFKFLKEEAITRSYDNKDFKIEYYILTKDNYTNR